MANASILAQPKINVTSSSRAVGAAGSNFATPANYSSITAMRTRLAAANGTYYTTARLDSLTVNDMVWALRSIDDPATISDYAVAQSA